MTKKVIGTLLIVFAIAIVAKECMDGSMEQHLEENVGFLVGYFGGLAAMVIGGIVLLVKGSKSSNQQ